jgi:hypothetical protein
MADVTANLTCSVVIYSTRDRGVRLCRRHAFRLIEVHGSAMFAVCARHRQRVRDGLGIRESTDLVDKANTRST